MPGPLPELQPKFRREHLVQAQEILRRRTLEQRLAQRARLATLLAEDGAIRNPEAARLLGVHENTVRNWRKRWVEEKFTLVDKPRPGRPRVFSPKAHRGGQGNRVRVTRAA
jgi:predicted ArsR family transcriptional regulator